jgi:predicted metal-dependent peptidase
MVPAMSIQDTQRAINNVVQAAHTAIASGNPGAVPGHIQLIISKFLKPIVPWEILLDRFFDERCNDDYSYSRPNRRFADIYMPSLQSDERLTHIIFYEDVSGSISDEDCQRFNSEVKHIKEKYNPEKLTLVQFDTKIQSEKTILEDDRFDEVVIVGRSGTSLRDVREHMMLHKPTAAVVFSDLVVTPMEPGPTCPILWVAIANKNATIPFGQLIHIKG